MMKIFIVAIGLVFIFEGLPYFAFPEKMKEFLRQLQDMPADTLRMVGFISMSIGLLLCYLAQRTNLFQ